jgi:Flp pilus assembly protein TadD
MRFAALVLSISFALASPAASYEAENFPKPNPQGSAFERGRIQIHQGNWDRAAGLFEKAVAENPRDFKALTLLGYSLRYAGRLDEAITAYNRAVKINPGYADVREYRGKAFVMAGKREAAMADYRALLIIGSPLAEDLKEAIDKAVN